MNVQTISLLIAVCVFVNHGCTCGPYLDPRKVANLPMVFNGKSINRVLRECVQSLVDAALDQKQIFGLLRQGEGRVVITGERIAILLYVISHISSGVNCNTVLGSSCQNN
jgi:hypothetical protein